VYGIGVAYSCEVVIVTFCTVTMCRFHNAAEEIVVGRDIVPPVSDSIRLTIDEYRSRLYEVLLVCMKFSHMFCILQ